MNHPFQTKYRKPKRTTVQLTSLLDLLFVMVFVSLLQQKTPPPPKVADTPKKVTPAPTPKVIIKEVIKEVEKKPPQKPKKTVYNIEAKFHFYAPQSNPKIPTGKYLMRGVFNTKTRKLQLGGIGWIDRPKLYDMVPLSGKIGSSNEVFTGRIEFQTCKQFTLERLSKEGSSPISGRWKGVYECIQGPTGLTLTIL